MNERGAFIAALLDSSRRAFAAGAVLRLQEAEPESARLVDTFGFQELVGDAQIRLQHLAEALACGRPELFALDVEWLAATHAARELPPAFLGATLSSLAAELDESLPPDAAAGVRPYFDAARERLANLPASPPSLLADGEPQVELARRFLLALLEGRRGPAAELVLEAHSGGLSLPDLHQHVIARAQAELGRMWQAGEVHVGEEHLGSRIVEDVLARLRFLIPDPPQGGHSVLVASVSGNLHDIGARIVADHFELNGWRSTFLGANVPADDLVRAVEDAQPDLIALSAGLSLHLRSAARTIEGLRAAFPGKPILIGGGPFARVPDLWRDVGADGCAVDAASALRTATELLNAG